MKNQDKYKENCFVDINSNQCKEFKINTCATITNAVYWPLDSPSVYDGCERTDDLDGCVCCQLESGFNNENNFYNISINIINTTSTLDIHDIRYYATTEKAVTLTNGLEKRLNYLLDADAPTVITCNDQRFFNQFLDADNAFYIPKDDFSNGGLQAKLTKQDAILQCQNTGGQLAVSENLDTPEDIEILTRACSQLSADDDTCWIAGEDRNKDDYKREDLIEDTCDVCYFEKLISSTPENLFTEKIIPAQLSTRTYISELLKEDFTYEYIPADCTVTFEGRFFFLKTK